MAERWLREVWTAFRAWVTSDPFGIDDGVPTPRSRRMKRYDAALRLIAEGDDKAHMRAIARSALWPWGNPSGELDRAVKEASGG